MFILKLVARALLMRANIPITTWGYAILHVALLIRDNAVIDAIKLILLIYNNFSIIKKVVNKIERVK